MTTAINGVQQQYLRNPYATAEDVQRALAGANGAYQGYVSAPAVQTLQADTFTPSTQAQQEEPQNSECTDGKDDGKISFWSKVGNAIKGVGKSIVKGVKGMFTNKEGKFSFGKTLLSIGTIAASIAFPAVGLTLCAAGAVAGGVQVVKGGVRAAKATTDTEAKEAWQNIGAGTFQVAASVAGAKASLGAMKATSTASNGLASLSKDATLGQKASALWADAKSSTVNRWGIVKDQAGTLARRVEIKNTINKDTANLQAQELTNAKARVEDLKLAGDTSSVEYQNALREVEIREAYTGKKADLYFAKNELQPTISSVKSSVTESVQNLGNSIKHPRLTIANAMDKIKNSNFRSNFNVSALSSKAQQAYKVLTTEGYSQAVTKCGYNTVLELASVIEAVDLETLAD